MVLVLPGVERGDFARVCRVFAGMGEAPRGWKELWGKSREILTLNMLNKIILKIELVNRPLILSLNQ